MWSKHAALENLAMLQIGQNFLKFFVQISNYWGTAQQDKRYAVNTEINKSNYSVEKSLDSIFDFPSSALTIDNARS